MVRKFLFVLVSGTDTPERHYALEADVVSTF